MRGCQQQLFFPSPGRPITRPPPWTHRGLTVGRYELAFMSRAISTAVRPHFYDRFRMTRFYPSANNHRLGKTTVGVLPRPAQVATFRSV